jgi:DNA-binding NtrC family response regulator
MEADMEIRGARILLLEDDALISLDAEDMLIALGAAQVYVAHTIDAAEAVLERETVDAAVLDVRIGHAKCDDLARRLQARATPFVFASGWANGELPEDMRHVPTVEKPYSAAALSDAFRALP